MKPNNNIKALHSGSLNVKSGGPALSTYLTIKGLTQNGVSTEIIIPPILNNDKLIANDISIHYTESIIYKRLGYMPNLKTTLNKLGNYDIYHIQGLWQYLGHAVASHARKINKPYIITLRGMLYPQALSHSSLIKKISRLLYQNNDLSKAACIQATCEQEMKYYRELGFTNPVAIIPNPIETTNIINRDVISYKSHKIGYIGRVHPRKRIERLIYAFDALKDKLSDWELVIIGSGDIEYENFLREEVSRLNLKNVKFTGFLSGEEKDKTLMSLGYLFVPSDFENFGNIVTEALVRGIPVAASKGTPWQELETHQCGFWITNDQNNINNVIINIIQLSDQERITMGNNGKRLIKEKYSVDILGQKMKSLYEWILYDTYRPDFIF